MFTLLDHPLKRAASAFPTRRISAGVSFRDPGLRPIPLPVSRITPPNSALAKPMLKPLPSRRLATHNRIELTTYFHIPLEKAYEGWTGCDVLPHFMRAVTGPCDAVAAAESSGWRLRLHDEEVPWEAVTTEKTPLKRIAWWSTGSRTHRNRGSVSFDAVGRRSTKLNLCIDFYGSDAFAVTEVTLRSLRTALEHSMDLLHLLMMPCPVLGPGPGCL